MKCGVCGGDDQNEMEKCCHCPVATHVECRGSAGIYGKSNRPFYPLLRVFNSIPFT